MKITKKEAIKNHRKMWNWIADQLEKGFYVTKSDYFKHHGITSVPHCTCYACEYNDQFIMKGGIVCPELCAKCPIDWGKHNAGERLLCTYEGSAYQKFTCAQTFEEKAKYAREIANLPVRKTRKKESD